MADDRGDEKTLMRDARTLTLVSLLPGWRKRLGERLGPAFSIIEVDPSDRQRLRAQLRDADILLTDRFSKELAEPCPALKLVVCPFAGTERIDRAALPDGVPIINGGGTEEPIAEYAIAMLVALRRRLFETDRKLREGEWAYTYWGEGFVEEVYGSTLGLVGYGRIGKEIVKRAVAFGITCRALTLHPERAVALPNAPCDVAALADPATVDALVAQSDAIVICCELSDVTRGLIDARRLRSMKPDAVLINVARGRIVVEHDLYEALRDKRIAGAAIDVWYKYPAERGERAAPSAYPFNELDNVIMTPHNSGWTKPAMARRIEMIARALETFAATAGP